MKNYWSIHTGQQDTVKTFLTGVVYNDKNGNLRYDIHEGLAGVTVTAGVLNTTSNAQGGWALEVTDGIHFVSCSGPGFTGTASINIKVNGRSREVDCVSGKDAPIVDFGLIPTYTITASAGPGGSISPSGSVSVTGGTDKTFTITANSGYEISDVTIDGSSVGAVSSYSFTNVQANHTIEATFSASTEWKLISLVKQPVDTSIESVLESISGKYLSVWAYIDGSWRVYNPNNPGFSDLITMEAGRGYWINMTEYAALSVTGSTPSKSIDLQIGWNLVGYNSSTS